MGPVNRVVSMPDVLPLISVIVPVYKVEEYLDQCVESIINQTYRNLEIILVDDGSPDQCPEMCEVWAAKDARIKVVHKVNGGLGDARNAGLAAATGGYVGFIDSDDWCELDMFQKLLNVCLLYDAPVSVCNVFIDWECGWATEQTIFAHQDECLERREILRRFFRGNLTAWACNKLYRKDMFAYLKYPKQSYEDIPVARVLFANALKVAFCSKSLYHYRQRQGSIVNSKVNSAQYKYIEELQKNVDMAKSFGLENDAVASMAVSSFNFLEKICANPSEELLPMIQPLVDNIRRGKPFLKKLSTRKLDKGFMWLLGTNVPYSVVFRIRRILQWFYWKLNLKKS